MSGNIKHKRVQDGQTVHVVENPWASAAWKLFRFPGGFCRVDQCRFGLRVRKGTHLKVRKPTRLQTNSDELNQQLGAQCQCPKRDTGHRHDHIISGDKIDGKWVSRSSRCGSWPLAFCHHILRHVEQLIGWNHTPFSGKAHIHNSVLPFEAFVEEDVSPEDAPPESASTQVQELVYKLHCKMGHPANSALARTLRFGGAKEEVVQAAKELKCSTCERVRAPKDPPKVSVCRADQFNQAVGIDLFFIQDVQGCTRTVLSIVDHATTFHILRMLTTKSPKEVAAVFHESWIGVFGPPQQLLYDQGSEFRTDFEYLLEMIATVATVIPVEAHWRGGVVERHGSTAKSIIRRLMDVHSVSTDEEFRCVLQEAASAKNSLSKQNGFSPLQWVLGHDHSFPGSVLDRPHDLSIHDHLQAGGKFAQKWNMRETARITWLQLDNSNRIRRAILARPRQQKETFVPGETVYFYHLQMSGRPNQTRNDFPQSWHGPAIVVTLQGPGVAWISWRRTLLKVPVENLRTATEEETLGHQIVQEELEEHMKDISGHGSKARGFLDLTETQPPEVDQSTPALQPGQHVTTEEVPLLGRRRVTGKRHPPAGFYDEVPEAKASKHENGDQEMHGETQANISDPESQLIPDGGKSQDGGQEPSGPNLSDLVPTLDQVEECEPNQDSMANCQSSDFEIDEGVHSTVPPTSMGHERSASFHERNDLDLPYGPVKHWKEHIHERQKARDSVEAHGLKRGSKFAEHLKKRAPPQVKDVFVSEIRYLQDLEQLESVRSNVSVKSGDVQFREEACHLCNCKHKKIFLAGVDEPLTRDEAGAIPENSKTSKEYKWKDLSSTEQQEFRKAMNKEWQSFLDLGAVTVVRGKQASAISQSRVLPTRFILTNKDASGKTLICKARLVCGGHLDPDISLLRTDAPTADTMGVNLVFLIAASKKWVLQAGDVSTAFLSGVNDFRALYLRPPKEGLEGVHQNDLLEMRKGVYGLRNAPRLWRRRLREVLLELGFVEMRMMQCVFMYWASDHQGNRKQLMGVLAVHVDDLIICGSVVFESVLARLKEKLTFGKWYVREFDYLGRHVKQLSNFFIELSQPDYPDKIPKVPITREQLNKEGEPVTEETRADLRRTAGSACWLAKSTRPDLSFEVSLLQQSLTEATYETVKQANTMVRRAMQHRYTILIPAIDLDKAVIVAVSDASPGKMPRSGSQGGLFLLISTPDICERRVPAACMFWLSHRLKRVARSSLATESMALCEAAEHGEFLRACFRELIDPTFDYRKWEVNTRLTQLIVGTDCRSIYDHIAAEKGLPRDRILALDLAALKSTFESQLREGMEGRNAVLRWVPGPHNLSDGLTKYISMQSLMIHVLREGSYTLADEDTLLASANKTRETLKLGDSKKLSCNIVTDGFGKYPWQ